MTELTVGVVASTRAWRTELQTYVRNHVAGVRMIVLREPRALFDDDFDVVVIDDVASLLTKHAIRQLRQRGIAIVGVHDPDEDDGAGARLLDDLGVDATVTASATPEELLHQIMVFGPAATLHEEVADYLGELEPDFHLTADGRGGDTGPGLIAVTGVTGEPAGVEVAGAMATVLAGRGERVVVVDVNEVAPTLARALGFGLEPNLLSPLDALRHGAAWASIRWRCAARGQAARSGWDAIVGLANTADWTQLRGADVTSLLEELGRRWDRVVAVAGPHLEELEGLGPGRFAASRATLGAADAMVGVAPATRLGVLAWLDWAADVADLLGPRPLWAVLRRVPRSPFKQAELTQAVRANIAPELLGGLVFLPDDARVEEAAWQAAPLRRGPFVKAIADLVAAVAPVTPGRRRRTVRAREAVGG